MKHVEKYKIELVTLTDIKTFTEIASSQAEDIQIQLTDGNYIINARSILGVMYALEWNNLWLIASEPVYDAFKNYIV